MSDLLKKPFTLDRVIRIIIAAMLFALGIYLLDRLSSVLFPFVLAMIIAYLLNPLVTLIQGKVKNRAVSVLLALIVVIGFFVGLGYVLVPMISKEVNLMALYLSKYTSEEALSDTQNELRLLINNYVTDEYVRQWLSEDKLVEVGEKTWAYVQNVLGSTLNLVFGMLSFVSMMIYLIFILIDYERIMYGWQKLIPNRYRGLVVTLVDDLKEGMNNYFRAQSLVAACVGVLFAIAFYIMGLPLGIAFGLFVGVLNLVPYMQLASLPIAAFLTLIYTFETGMNYGVAICIVLAIYGVVQTIQDTVIVPKLMGKVMGLNAAVILLSLSVWGSLLGMLGMLIALPVTTILFAYYQRYLNTTEKDEQLRLFEE